MSKLLKPSRSSSAKRGSGTNTRSSRPKAGSAQGNYSGRPALKQAKPIAPMETSGSATKTLIAPAIKNPDHIPFFIGPDDGGTFWWRPSRKWRALGFRDENLGKLRANAETQAILLNRQMADWAANPANHATPPVRLQRAASFGEMLARYRAEGMGAMAPSTKAEALGLMKRLEDRFAHEQPQMMTRRVVRDWLDGIGKAAPQSRRQLGLRLRAIWNWALAEEVTFADNPVATITLGSGNRRKTLMSWEDARVLVACADELGDPVIGDIIVLAFACLLRLSDAVILTGRALQLVQRPGEAAPHWRLIYTQNKTGAGVDMALPPVVVQRLGARLEALSLHPEALICPIAGDRTAAARRFAPVRALARTRRLTIPAGLHLRDCRRSGFVQYVLDGAPVEWVCSISGHTVKDGYEIVEHYLPKTPEQADSAVRLLKVSL
jgi:hypothetical protein